MSKQIVQTISLLIFKSMLSTSKEHKKVHKKMQKNNISFYFHKETIYDKQQLQCRRKILKQQFSK